MPARPTNAHRRRPISPPPQWSHPASSRPRGGNPPGGSTPQTGPDPAPGRSTGRHVVHTGHHRQYPFSPRHPYEPGAEHPSQRGGRGEQPR